MVGLFATGKDTKGCSIFVLTLILARDSVVPRVALFVFTVPFIDDSPPPSARTSFGGWAHGDFLIGGKERRAFAEGLYTTQINKRKTSKQTVHKCIRGLVPPQRSIFIIVCCCCCFRRASFTANHFTNKKHPTRIHHVCVLCAVLCPCQPLLFNLHVRIPFESKHQKEAQKSN